MKKNKIEQKNGRDPVVLEFKGSILSNDQSLKLKHNNVALWEFSDRFGDVHVFIDLKKSQMSLTELFTCLQSKGEKQDRNLGTEIFARWNDIWCAFCLCRRTNAQKNKIVYEKCKSAGGSSTLKFFEENFCSEECNHSDHEQITDENQEKVLKHAFKSYSEEESSSNLLEVIN